MHPKGFKKVSRQESLEMQRRYQKLHTKYLAHADNLLAQGDLSQAAEKYWGAVAAMVKKVAAKRGINLQTHQSIRDFVKDLSDHYPDIDLRSDFVTCGYLHSNFYEDGMSSWEVEGAAEAAKRLIKKLENL